MDEISLIRIEKSIPLAESAELGDFPMHLTSPYEIYVYGIRQNQSYYLFHFLTHSRRFSASS